MVTEEILQTQLGLLKKAKHAINKNQFLKQQLQLKNIKLSINYLNEVHLCANIFDEKTPEDIITGELSYLAWKEKTRKEFNKAGFFHNKNTYMSYKFKTE